MHYSIHIQPSIILDEKQVCIWVGGLDNFKEKKRGVFQIQGTKTDDIYNMDFFFGANI
jgi:hypothetical protein